MSRRLAALMLVGSCVPTGALGQVLPPGYKDVVEITNDSAFNYSAAINNRGQIVFSKWINPNDPSTSEIYLYDNGKLTRLTDDNIWDDYPDINDAAEIVWSRAVGSNGTLEIVLWRDARLTRLTYDDLRDSESSINNGGLIAWKKATAKGCGASDADIYLYDGADVRRISDGWLSNQSPHLNDLGDIIWTRYNFCHSPWTSEIMLYSDGRIEVLTGDQGAPRRPRINNARLAAWFSAEPPGWDDHIVMWQSGRRWLLTDWGSALDLNDRADVVFNRWHEESRTWQVWLYREGRFSQITNDPFWNRSGVIDRAGNIAWTAGPTFDSDIRLLRRYAQGDLNCDKSVNNFDIDPFVVALTDPQGYGKQYPLCDCTLADINVDGAVNNFDIDPFVELLSK